MFRSRPVTTSWRGQSRIRDSQRSRTPIAPDVVHSIADDRQREQQRRVVARVEHEPLDVGVDLLGQEAVELVGHPQRGVVALEEDRLERREPERERGQREDEVVGERRNVVGDPRAPIEVEEPPPEPAHPREAARAARNGAALAREGRPARRV